MTSFFSPLTGEIIYEMNPSGPGSFKVCGKADERRPAPIAAAKRDKSSGNRVLPFNARIVEWYDYRSQFLDPENTLITL